MSRSNHNGCGGPCGVCKPHKRFRTNGLKNANRKTKIRRVPWTKDETR